MPFASLPASIADDPTIPPLDKAILLVLAGHAWGGKDVCWPSNATIAAKIGCSPGHLKRRLKAIEERGLIVREPSPLNRTGRQFRLRWRDPLVAPAPRLPGSRARPESEASERKKKEERPESESGQEGPPPPAVEKGEEPPASAEDLAKFRAWAEGAEPVLARFGRAALKLAGVVEPVVDDPATTPTTLGVMTPVPVLEAKVLPPAPSVPVTPPCPKAASMPVPSPGRPPCPPPAGGTPTKACRPFLAGLPRRNRGPRQVLERIADAEPPTSPLVWLARRAP